MTRFRRTLALAVVCWAVIAAIVPAGELPRYDSSVYHYTDRQPASATSILGFLNASSKDGYFGSFDLTKLGYDPSKMRITAARISFAFADDGDASDEFVSVILHGDVWAPTENQEIDGTRHHAPANFDYFDQVWEASSPADQLFLEKLQNGRLPFQVTATTGDVYLTMASLEVTIVPKAAVPDHGSTLLLLLAALAGVITWKRTVSFPAS
ncbi:MAG TPA: VPDSG-CTERM sorting domain-containing protein [Opitutaceae bacterium]|nr:VPDSG-CTERM sorting domain-containing protein [Opitutaceae bacterium]